MRTHLHQADTSTNSNMFHIFVIEAPCMAMILCELRKCTLSSQRFEGQVCLRLSQVTEERHKVLVQLRVA